MRIIKADAINTNGIHCFGSSVCLIKSNSAPVPSIPNNRIARSIARIVAMAPLFGFVLFIGTSICGSRSPLGLTRFNARMVFLQSALSPPRFLLRSKTSHQANNTVKSHCHLRYAFVFAALLLLLGSCSLILDTLRTGGEKELPTAVQVTSQPGPRVIIFALDGTAPDELLRLIRSGEASNLAALLGKDRGSGLFEHGYAAPRAWSILPSSTIAAWAATFTGVPPAQNVIM